MNNDTPQVFGEDTHDHTRNPGPWPDHLAAQDGEDFPAFRGWAGWGERVEPVAPDEDYPPPAFSLYEPAPHEQEYPHRPGPGQPGYPQDPGHGPDSGYARDLEYPHDPGADYPADASYPPDHGYPAGLGFAEDPGYAALPGFGRDPGPVPPMEPLPGTDDYAVMSAPVVVPSRAAAELAPPPEPADAPLPTRIPRDGYHAYAGEVFAPPPPMAEPDYERETSGSLTTESLLHGKRAAPGSGWRRGVYRATGGLLRFGESAAEMRRRDLINRVRTPVAGGHHRVAVLSLKGGVGKTTTAVGLGATLATLRGDRVIAVDAHPDRGT